VNIIVTGASKGIGFDTVLTLSQHNNNRIIALARNYTDLVKLQELCLQQHNNRIFIATHDLSQKDFSQLQAVLQNFLSIDVLINNAGLLINKPFLNLNQQDWTNIFSVNLFGVVTLIKYLFPYLKKANRAHIVNIGSMGGFQHSQKFAGLSAYSASKAALANITECLALEWQNYNIACNCLCLGAVNTDMLQTAFPNYKAPLNSKDMATFISHFALNAQQYLNGKIIPVSLSTP